MEKQIVVKNFSKNAVSYDAHSSIQKFCAKQLCGMIFPYDYKSILEIGCGTGFYTEMLREQYPTAHITAVDISDKMIHSAKKRHALGNNVEFKTVDAEKMFLDTKFDLITSNASFQWFENVELSIKRFSEMLNYGGIFCFSMYGRETFSEFEKILKFYFGADKVLSSTHFLPDEVILRNVKKSFRDVFFETRFLKTRFNSLLDFLREIKFAGCRGHGLQARYFLGKNTLNELEHLYKNKFGGIIATHHVLFYLAKGNF